MKKILFITMILIAGCSSQPTTSTTTSDEATLPKAAPPPSEGERVYRGAAPTAIKATPAENSPVTEIERKGCETPLGFIPDGGKATGYLSPTVPVGEICISDTITCSDGKWSGQAIHPSCKTEKAK
ncbi:hypothetical protein [uncultured Bdellovibrio sp.]|uniref:hypothetical protein n=1 Tax=Bdellovibrio sp. HCB-162 TaxID=3394234 RepID=UPI0025DFD62A|nr:hypothetical protein [uncultured Bdellovibrio sp.]